MPVNTVSAVDVPLSTFGGLNTELGEADIPEGVSPDNQDVAFLPGQVFSRPCLEKQLASAVSTNTAIVYLRTYTQPDGTRMTLLLANNGNLYKEAVDGTVTLISTITASNRAISANAFGREYIAFSDGQHGVDIPRQWDGTNLDRVSQDGPGANITTVADSATPGVITVGVHKYVVIFQTRQGYLTRPCPIDSWSAAGSFKVELTGIPIGPANVIARVIAFTAAGGDNFFYIPVAVSGVDSTVIPDNTTTTATIDFSDNALLAATAIDIPGNNLFELVTLGSCLGVFSYASRMFWWGERNKLQNLLNMGFDGGYYAATPTVPLGWTVATAGGALSTTADALLAWKITGTGGAGAIGEVTQPAYQDEFSVPIILSGTDYKFRLWGKSSGTGNIVAELYSAGGGGVLATAIVDIQDFPVGGGFVESAFDNQITAPVPTDLILRVYAENQVLNDAVYLDEMEIIYTADPFFEPARASYVNNPESFDAVSGVIGPASDPSQLLCAFIQRDSMYLITGKRLHTTHDVSSTEPSGWTVQEVANDVGAISAFGCVTGEDWAAWPSQSGVRMFEGGHPYKVSQEIQGRWDAINFEVAYRSWMVNDPNTRRIYAGVPLDGAESPNKILVLDYREMDTAGQIAFSPSIHNAYSGKLITSDIARKWTTWNLPMECGALLIREPGKYTFCVGSGRGVSPSSGYGNFYSFSEDKLTDDDYGQVSPYYVTYFFMTPEMEQMYKMQNHRKLCVMMAAAISGTGKMTITPYVNNLQNPWSVSLSYTMAEVMNFDLEWAMNVLGNRIAFKFAPAPLANTTDVRFTLQSMGATLKTDPWMVVRGLV